MTNETTKGIVLSTIRYGENSLIAHILTLNEGRKSFIVNAKPGVRKDNVRAMLQPLTLIEFVETGGRLGRMGRLTQTHLQKPFVRIPFDIARRQIAFFVAELLERAVPQDVPDPSIYFFAQESIEALDSEATYVANFHLCFMMQLADILGFGPDPDRYTHPLFDLESGQWADHTLHDSTALTGRIADLWDAIRQGEVDPNIHERVRMSREERALLLDALMKYYRIHHPTFHEMKSHEVLKLL